jgi:hypothetical protein
MTGSKKIMTDMRPNVNNITITYGDMSQFEVLGLGKVVVALDISLVDVMLVETLGYNLLSVRALRKWALPSLLIMILWYYCGASL